MPTCSFFHCPGMEANPKAGPHICNLEANTKNICSFEGNPEIVSLYDLEANPKSKKMSWEALTCHMHNTLQWMVSNQNIGNHLIKPEG